MVGNSATNAIATSKSSPATQTALFGDLPEGKRRKFILVDDPNRGSRVRVRVTLDNVETEEIPDSYRKSYSVFPRCCYPVQSSPEVSSFVNDDAQDVAGPRRGKQTVSLPMYDGTEVSVALPKVGS